MCGNRHWALNPRRWKSISNEPCFILKTCFIWVSAKNQKRISDWHATALTASLGPCWALEFFPSFKTYGYSSHIDENQVYQEMYEDWFEASSEKEKKEKFPTFQSFYLFYLSHEKVFDSDKMTNWGMFRKPLALIACLAPSLVIIREVSSFWFIVPGAFLNGFRTVALPWISP